MIGPVAMPPRDSPVFIRPNGGIALLNRLHPAPNTLRRLTPVLGVAAVLACTTVLVVVPPHDAFAQTAAEDASRLLVEADNLASRQPDQAAALYRQIADNTDASDKLRATAEARILGLRASSNGASVQSLLDAAMTDLRAGRISAAQDKAQKVRASNTELGWFDNDRLSRIDRAVAQSTPAAAVEASPAVQLADEDPAIDNVDAPEANPLEPAPMRSQPMVPMDDPVAPAAADPAEDAPDMDTPGAESVSPNGVADSDMLARATQAHVDSKLIDARRALENGQTRRADELARDVLALQPDNEQARQIVQQAGGQQFNVIDGAASRRTIEWQKAKAQYAQAMELARTQRSEGRWESALASTQVAVLSMEGARDLAPKQEIDSRVDQAVTLQSAIQTQQRQERLTQIEAADDAQATAAMRAAAEARQRQQKTADDLLRTAWDLRKQRRYEEALQTVDRALNADPNNITAQFMHELIRDAKVQTDWLDAKKTKDLYQGRQRVHSLEATIPYDELLVYPVEWPRITVDRLRQLSTDGEEAEANRDTIKALQTITDATYDQTPLSAIIDNLRDITQANISVNWPALEQAGVSQDLLVSLRLANVPADRILDLILEQASADASLPPEEAISYAIIDGIIKIDSAENLKTATDARVYDIRDLLVEVPNFTNAPTFSLSDALSNTNSGGGGAGGGSGGGGGGGDGGGLFGDEEEDAEDEGPTKEELIIKITELIQDSVGSSDEWLDEQSTIKELNGNLIIKTTPNNHRDIIGLLAQLRETRAIQISVESRFLIVDQNFLEEFAVDIDARYKASGNFGPIQVAQDSVSLAQRLGSSFTGGPVSAGTDFDKNDAGGGRSLTLGVSFIDDLEVDLLVSATLANSKSTSLNAPRVTFFNGQRAYVLVARQIAFVSDLEPIPDSIGFDPTVSVVSEGVVLDVTGTISADRRYVTMTVRPSLATVDQPIDTFPIIGVAQSDDGGDDEVDGEGIPTIDLDNVFVGQIQVPEVSITSVRATVSVPDRGTLLLGGQRVVTEAEVEAGVPVLSKLPILNRLFTNTSTVKEERTLLILIKPTIIIQSEQEEALYPGLNDDPEAYIIGR